METYGDASHSKAFMGSSPPKKTMAFLRILTSYHYFQSIFAGLCLLHFICPHIRQFILDSSE